MSNKEMKGIICIGIAKYIKTWLDISNYESKRPLFGGKKF